jgi:hypothetical protein
MTWRFWVNETTGEIFRSRIYQVPDDGGDRWRWYWEGDFTVAFIDNFGPGYLPLTDGEDTQRAIYAADAIKGDQSGAMPSTVAHRLWSQYDALDRVAVRLEGSLDARFVTVPLDRGSLLYLLTYDGDPNRSFRDEVEALYNGDVWDMEVEAYDEGWPGNWRPEDGPAEVYYGETYARETWEAEYPLAEFPAERLVGADQ